MKQQLVSSTAVSLFCVSPPTLFECVCLINSDIYKGLTLPQEITLSLSLRLRTAWEAPAASAASKGGLMLLPPVPIVQPVTHSCTLPP